MISPAHRRRAVARVQRELPRVSERRACSVIGQPRSTQRHQPKQPEKDRPVVKRMLELVRERPQFGYRRIAKRLRREERFRGINVKRVHRLWRQEGLRVPQKQVKKRRLGSSEGGCVRHRAEHRDHVWCYDFLSDQTEDGRTLKFLPIEDEFTRECLALEVDRRLRSGDVIELLRDLFEVRGAPAYIRSDNGPEFIAGAVRRFLAESNVQTLFIEPGAPWERLSCWSSAGWLFSEDRVEVDEQLSHASDQGKLFRLAGRSKVLVMGGDDRVVARGDERGHVKRAANRAPSTADTALPPMLPGVVIEWRYPHQRGDGTAIELSELR